MDALVWPVTPLALSLTLGVAAFRRNLPCRSEAALWKDSVAKAPHNARAHHNQGCAYGLAGDFDRAILEYRTGLSLKSGNKDIKRVSTSYLESSRRDARPASRPADGSWAANEQAYGLLQTIA